MLNRKQYKKYHELVLKNKKSYLNKDTTSLNELYNYIINNISKDSKILEIGAGGGHFSAKLYKSGFRNIIASDFENSALANINKNYPFLKTVNSDATNLSSFNKNSIDLIISIELVEHIVDDIDIHFKNINRILKQKGLYVIKTPNQFLNKFVKCFTGKNWDHPYFTIKSLKNILNKHGFKKTHFLHQKKLTACQFDINKLNIFIPSCSDKNKLKIANIYNKILPILPKNLTPSILCITKKDI